MTRPKRRPRTQIKRPQMRSFCPVMAPLRKETEPRSGRTRLASLLASGAEALCDSCGATAGLADGCEVVGTDCACAAATQSTSSARTSTRIVHDFIKTSESFSRRDRAGQRARIRAADCSRTAEASPLLEIITRQTDDDSDQAKAL